MKSHLHLSGLLAIVAGGTIGCTAVPGPVPDRGAGAARAAGVEPVPGCPACATDAAYVSDAALLERPTPLRRGVGRIHQEVTTRSPQAQAFHDQGLAYLCSYVWIEAARSFHEALRLDPDCAMAWVGLARAEQGLSRHAASRAAIGRAQALAPECTAREQRFIALRAQQIEAQLAPPGGQKQKHAEYARAIDDALRAFPDDADLWVLRGNCEEASPAGRGQRGTAASIAFYEAALKRSPDHLGAHHFLVHSHENIGNYAAAIEHARVYVAAAPNVPHAHHMAGHVLPRLGQWGEALERFRAADALELEYARSEGLAPGDDWHHEHNLVLLGWTCLRLGKTDEAVRTFERLVATPIRDPLLDYNHVALAELLLVLGRNDEALRAADKVAGEAGASARVAGHSVAAQALLALGRHDAAKARAAQATAAMARGKEALPNQAADLQQLVGYFVELAEALVHDDEPRIRAYAESVAQNPRFDSWGAGLFRLQRIGDAAARAGRTELAAAIRAQMRRIDADHGGSQ